MSSKRTRRQAIGTIAIAATVCGGVAVMMTHVRFGAQDARSPRASFATALDAYGLGQDGQNGKSRIVISLPDGSSGSKSFVGEIGSRDEATFVASDGSRESLQVWSLDDRLGTLVAVRPMGPAEAAFEDRSIGDAYAFRRQDGGASGDRDAYALKWSARGMDSALAIDVDTHIELHGGTVAQALKELRTERSDASYKASARSKRSLFVRR